MFISVLEIFKIGIGPSSSHTMGPMVAANRFLDELRTGKGTSVARLGVTLYGSLAFTGKGHATDRAVILGLAGLLPEVLDYDHAEATLAAISGTKQISAPGLPTYSFDPAVDIVFDYGPALPGHANGLWLHAYDQDGQEIHATIYYSIGGGFVLTADELEAGVTLCTEPAIPKPFPFKSAQEMLRLGKESGKSILEMKRANELCLNGEEELTHRLDKIWSAMNDCIDRGLATEGTLPGGLAVKRRASAIYKKLSQHRSNALYAHEINDWISTFAMAVNEENAAGGQVVTAPTNGAAGVIPAVIRYYLEFCPGAQQSDVRDFLLVAAAIGGLIKHNASISGAEVGCQGEVGSASAMAAAGLCAVLGGTNEQIENAAEIALEHHLGMTCDPVKGLVQVPCIERNGFGAVKAVTAASLALKGDGSHVVELDKCVETMRQTGFDMSLKYKETSTGGLAVNVVAC